MEDTNKKHNKTPQEEHVNFQETKEDIKYRTHFENAESEIAAKNEQTVQKCALRSEEKVCKKIPTGIHGTTEKQVTPNFANDSTETIPENVLSKGSNSSDTHNINQNGINPHSMSDNSSINKPCSLTMDEFTCGKQASVWLETPTNFIPTNSTTHKTVRKRHMGDNERSKQSEHEFVIHHEHCENLDSVSKKEDSSEDTVINADQPKISLQGIKSEPNREPVELPEDLIKDLTQNTTKDFSLFRYLQVEVTRRYLFEEKEEKYLDQREKVYTFMKTPRELEKLMWFGFLLCLDCFLFVFTYLPVRVLLALIQLLGNVVCLKFLRNKLSLLEPHQTCDMLRGFILLVCCAAMNRLDLSILYHIVRGQSVIKLYVIYNMLDIADRLFSSIGQDTLDALFWTAAAPRQKRRIITIVLHFGLASVYVFLHAVLVLFQAITLNVAINSHNKVLMVVMVSNQFVELKGSVFKKFEKNNLFQMSCADIRERFYYVVLVSLVTLRNMHELQWNLEHLYELIPSVALLLFSEVFVDWVKHAFITKFNCISSEVYREYRELLALDAATSRLFGQRASSDHFDLVSRRLGFIPLPLACVVYRVTSQSVKITGTAGIVVLVLVYLWLTSVKILNSIILLGLSSHYVINKTSDKNEIKPAMESSPNPSDFQLPVADPLDRDPNKLGNVSKPRQVKALNEIDRYTLCSNRIV